MLERLGHEPEEKRWIVPSLVSMALEAERDLSAASAARSQSGSLLPDAVFRKSVRRAIVFLSSLLLEELPVPEVLGPPGLLRRLGTTTSRLTLRGRLLSPACLRSDSRDEVDISTRAPAASMSSARRKVRRRPGRCPRA